MILSQPDLRAAVEKGEIVFNPPLIEKQWGEASIDLRLGFRFTTIKKAPGARFSLAQGVGLSTIAASGLYAMRDLKEKDDFGKRELFTIEPNEFVLAMTLEKIQMPGNLIALVEGRSTYARMGLTIHQTAPWIQPGWSGNITLEIRNSGPLHIDLTPVIDMPCQLTFFQLTTGDPCITASP